MRSPSAAVSQITGFIPLHTEAEFDRALLAPLAVLFKHSPRCSISARAYQEVEDFLRSTEQPVFLVDVIRDRSLSRLIAERTGVLHESPQVLVLAGGGVLWHGSHGEVTADELFRQTAGRPSAARDSVA